MSVSKDQLSKNAVQKTYHFYAPIYDFLFGAVLEPGRKALIKEIITLNPKKVLEIGVGTGLLLPQYPKNTAITGIDISEDMLKIAMDRAHKLTDQKIQLMTMDAEALSFADESFDCVVLPYVLSVTPNPEKLVSEVRRVCKNGGTIMIVNHFSGNGFWYLLEKIFSRLAEKIGFRSEFSYEKNVLKHGWQVQSVKTVNLFGLSKLVVIKNVNYD